jgi:hypothetical protein
MYREELSAATRAKKIPLSEMTLSRERFELIATSLPDE